MNRNVLFVDDEPRILDGLRRMLRPLRQEWTMEFVTSGSEALSSLEQRPYDVLVTDMRMPGLDGCQLLQEVRRRFPRVARMVLTGECDRDISVKLMALAHRHLAKPCDAATLKDAVARACALQELLGNPILAALISRLQSVPSLPSLYLKVVKELESPEPSLQKVGRIIAQDLGMAAKIMQVVNSALIGLACKAVNPERAVAILGTEHTRALVLATELFSRFDPKLLEECDLGKLWTHSIHTSRLARAIMQAEQATNIAAEYASMAGMLHDIGRLVLAAHMTQEYRQALDRVTTEGCSLTEAERQVFGASHAEVGAYLLGLWGLPTPVVEAVAWHHRPAVLGESCFGAILAVHVADSLGECDKSRNGESGGWLDVGHLENLGLSCRLAHWRELAKQQPESDPEIEIQAEAEARC